MKITLRAYQKKLVDEVREAIVTYKRVIVQLSTGGGKTVCFSQIAQQAKQRNSQVLILTNREEILKQNGRSLNIFGIDVEYITPSRKSLPKEEITVAMAKTLQSRLRKSQEWIQYVKGINLLIIDEAHSQDFDYIFDYITDDCYVLGFTATPKRYGQQKQLGLMYEAIVTGPTKKYLVGQGWLCSAKHYALQAPKLDSDAYCSVTGDYYQNKMAKAFTVKERYSGVVDNYLRLVSGTKAIVFCASSQQAMDLCAEFNLRGVKARFLLSKKTGDNKSVKDSRRKTVDDFVNNEFKVLVNVGIATAGFDVPDVETIILDYATLSYVKYAQTIGRGSRPSTSKTHFNILDFGGNIERHGMFDSECDWSVWHKTSLGGGIALSKECPLFQRDRKGQNGCGHLLHSKLMKCPFCGFDFLTEKEILEVELHEIVGDETDINNMTIEQYAAKLKLEGMNPKTILKRVVWKNPKRKKEAFLEAAKVLGISPYYWKHFKKYILHEKDNSKDQKLVGRNNDSVA